MVRGRFVFAILGLVLLISLLVVGGYYLVQFGWAQGYQAGLLTAGGETLPQIPFRAIAPFGAGFGILPILCFSALLFFFGLFLLRFLFFGRHFRAWKKYGNRQEGGWDHPWPHGPYWHGPPTPDPEPDPEAVDPAI